MPHINKLYDFVVTIFITHRNRVLLVDHKRYNHWLPIGGHIELDEDPDTALLREIEEECGLKVKILSNRPRIKHKGVAPQWTPAYVDSHHIKGSHRHIAFIYFGESTGDKVILHEREHRRYHWFTAADLKSKKYGLSRSIRYYAEKALEASA